MVYEYITENNLYHKQSYMYSEYGGIEFLKAYLYSRQKYMDKYDTQFHSNEEIVETDSANLSLVGQELRQIRNHLRNEDFDDDVKDLVNAYTKSFEVRKRIYNEYDNTWKPVEQAEFEDYAAYLMLADCLLLSYGHTKCLKYISCLLKVDDTLLSIQNRLDGRLKYHLCDVIRQELGIFYQLVNENSICLEVNHDIR